MSDRSAFGAPLILAIIPRARGEELRITVDSHAASGRRWGRLNVWFRAADGEMRPGSDHVSIKVDEIAEVEKAIAAMRRELTEGGPRT